MQSFLMKGNEALSEAAIHAGCRYFFGYPITPQTEVAAYMANRMSQVGGTYLQAESEIASINMVLGAAATGVRVMTSSSSPGISLMSEGISYLAGMDLPCLIVNVQRGGPGLGGIQPSQSDYYQATKALGHGDFHLLVYAPSSIQEIVDLVERAFDRSDKYRVPAMILADGSLGQMMEPVKFPDKIKEPGDLPQKEWAANGTKEKRKPNILNSLILKPAVLEKSNFERFERYEKIKQDEKLYENYMTDDAEIVLVAYGTTARIVKTVVKEARSMGIKAGLFRPITLWPYPSEELANLTKTANKFLCVEMNMGQMVDDIRLSVGSDNTVDFYGRAGGMVPRPKEIMEKIQQMMNN